LEQNNTFKVSILTWRTLHKMIPTKDNLAYRGVVHSSFLLCSGGCGKEESINHLFLECDFLGSIWNFVLHWLWISYVLPVDVCMHEIWWFSSVLERYSSLFSGVLVVSSLSNLKVEKLTYLFLQRIVS
jgi:hypothetical protein